MLQKDILLILFFIHKKKKSLPYLVMIRDRFILLHHYLGGAFIWMLSILLKKVA